MSFTSPLLGSSPPAKSPSLPIRARGGLSRSLQAAPQGTIVQSTDRRSSDTGQPRQQQSFSYKTPFASMASTSTSSSAARPPVVPAVHRPSLRVEGFQTVSENSNVALSPGRLQLKSSLLTASLLEPGVTFSTELFGAVQPQHPFQVGAATAWHGFGFYRHVGRFAALLHHARPGAHCLLLVFSLLLLLLLLLVVQSGWSKH